IRTLSGFNAVTFLDGTGGQSGSNNGIDANGQLVFSAFFSNASQAILVSDLVASIPSLAGDIDGDVDVDGADYLQIQRDNLALIPQWEVQYGTGPGSLSSSTAVPEPSSLLLLVLGMMAIHGRAR
ncbi:MAG: PEP-CTERM sorting domain-containing protein, partial [Bythopirellula sp.]